MLAEASFHSEVNKLKRIPFNESTLNDHKLMNQPLRMAANQ